MRPPDLHLLTDVLDRHGWGGRLLVCRGLLSHRTGVGQLARGRSAAHFQRAADRLCWSRWSNGAADFRCFCVATSTVLFVLSLWRLAVWLTAGRQKIEGHAVSAGYNQERGE